MRRPREPDGEGYVFGVVTATLDAFVALRGSGSLPQNVNYAVNRITFFRLLPISRRHPEPNGSSSLSRRSWPTRKDSFC
jgi:hypothetical protein